MVSCGTVRKVTNDTINSGADKGETIETQGYRCKAKKITLAKPTGGWTKWRCKFQAADTPTVVKLRFKQYSD